MLRFKRVDIRRDGLYWQLAGLEVVILGGYNNLGQILAIFKTKLIKLGFYCHDFPQISKIKSFFRNHSQPGSNSQIASDHFGSFQQSRSYMFPQSYTYDFLRISKYSLSYFIGRPLDSLCIKDHNSHFNCVFSQDICPLVITIIYIDILNIEIDAAIKKEGL